MARLRTSLIAAALCISTGAVAQTASQNDLSRSIETGSPAVGVGVICDTAAQVERLIALRGEGTAPEHAIVLVNTEASNPQACGIAATAFVPGKAVANVAVEGGTIRVMEITVIATVTQQGLQRVPEQTQYTAVFVKSVEA